MNNNDKLDYHKNKLIILRFLKFFLYNFLFS